MPLTGRLWHLGANLAAPAMMLTLALSFDGGYGSQTWWPWRHEATSIPAACKALDRLPEPDPVTALVGQGEGNPNEDEEVGKQTSECQWGSGPDPRLTVTFHRYDHFVGKTGTDRARDTFDETLGTDFRGSWRQPLTSLGDRAVIHDPAKLPPNPVNRIGALILQANVVVHITYEGALPPGPAAHEVERLARQAMSEIGPSFHHRMVGLVQV
ncbi:hypothetical protein GCM10014713_45280 [Streptomyces purpureus]|uniref:DUF3558 domain-containing protein n=2 Tax=Streptomyces purpureus TaxID=1951 RepID=A0A918LTB0_9ACTN|nr:hypothetical protein GCM10014713_45280 [Streptomyces purpureus]